MGRRQVELGALAVGQIGPRGFNFVGGVAGLGLNVTSSGARSWVLRYQIAGRRADKGLGGYPDVTLAQAKELARVARAKISQSIDPVDDGDLRPKIYATDRRTTTVKQQWARYATRVAAMLSNVDARETRRL